MMTCDKCGKDTYIIFITKNHEKLCDECYDKERKTRPPKFPTKD
jgi:ribosomal protein L37E